MSDIRLACRQLARTPGSTAAAVLTLALGISATASTFSLVKGLVLDPLPYPEPERLAQVWTKDAGSLFDFMPLSTPDFLDLHDRLTTLDAFGAFAPRRFNVGGDTASAVEGALCTAGVFRAFAVAPLLGRWLTEDDVAGEGRAVAVVSHRLWRHRLGSAPDAVGSPLRIDGREFIVVGVMPASFELLSMWTRDRPLDLWIPLALRRGGGGRENYWMASVARLKPGVPSEQAGAELRTAAEEFRKSAPDTNARRTFWLMPLQQGLGGLPALRVSVLLGAAWTLLVLAAQTVAGMMFARGVSRQAELVMRIALGASRLRIIRLVLAESLVLAALAGGLGLLLTMWFMDALTAALPASVLPRAGLTIDAWLLGCVALLAILTVQMSGLAPALLASKTDVVTGIKEGVGGRVGARRTQLRLRRLVIVQIGLALLLVHLAVQLSRTYRDMLAGSGATVSEEVLTAAIAVKGPGYDRPGRVAFWNRFLAATAALPGVTETAVTTKLPLDGGVSMHLLVDDEPYDPAQFRPYVEVSSVSTRFFAAIGAGLLHGRVLADADESPARRVAVINRVMAARYWPGRNPIGRRIRPAQAATTWTAEVVGVVEDVRQVAERPARPEVYFPYAHEPAVEGFLVVRTAPGLPAPLDGIREALRRVDPDLALSGVATMKQRFEDAGRVVTVVAAFVDALTVAILAQAALGLYGTLSFTFAQRRRDIGLRIALGAPAAGIVALVMRQAFVWVSTGAAIGVAASWLLARGLRSLLEDASPIDPMQLVSSVGVIAATAALAAWFPAWRAVRVDPVEALRAE